MNTNVIIRRLVSLRLRCLATCSNQSRAHQTTPERCHQNRDWAKYSRQRFFCLQANQVDCWHCKAKTKKVNNFVCGECGKLQDITNEYNYFQLLSLPQDFDVPTSKLTTSFRQLQSVVHPDKFSNKSEREKKNSADWSALINKAYKILSQPIARGQYLLKLNGEDMPSDNSTMNKEFLMEMMERNEEVDDATTEKELKQLNDKIQEEVNHETEELKNSFNSHSLQEAKKKLVRMKYLLSIQSNIKTKLEKLMYK